MPKLWRGFIQFIVRSQTSFPAATVFYFFEVWTVACAMRDAFRKMRRFLMTVHKLSEDEAISLMSVGADFGVTQVVDANWGVHGTIRKNVFRCD